MPFPSSPGSYLLAFCLEQPIEIAQGRLGAVELLPGWYYYAGSAKGSGGLRARLERHRRHEKRLFWHVDWLSQAVAPLEGFYALGMRPLECEWARLLVATLGGRMFPPGFGASDCRRGCAAHLVYFVGQPDENLIQPVLASVAGSEVIHWRLE